MSEQAYITLSTFDWRLMISIGGILLAALAFMIGMVVKMFLSRAKEETKERKEGDEKEAAARKEEDEKEAAARKDADKVESLAREKVASVLAGLISEATKNLRAMSDDNLRAHAEFANVDYVRESHTKIYGRIEDVMKTCTRIEANMVTQEQCTKRCAHAS